jgi:F420 biosynthesis protein FbiB-like protein
LTILARDRQVALERVDFWGGVELGGEGLATARRSIRRYRKEPVSPAQVERILLAATAAPSAHNRQPWRFAIVEPGPRRVALAAAMGERLRSDRLAQGDDAGLVAADVARSEARIIEAPALILSCLSMADMDLYPDEARNRAEYVMAVQSVAMAVQNMLLAVHAEGLGACIMCGPLFCSEVVNAVLELEDDWQPQNFVTIGHPLNAGRSRERKPVSAVTIRIGGD